MNRKDTNGKSAHMLGTTEAEAPDDGTDKELASGTAVAPPYPLEENGENEAVDALVHAQKVLGEVQVAKRDMEMRCELEETERAFSDLVQALSSASDEE